MHFNLNLATINADVATVLASWTALCAMISLLNKYALTPLWPNGAKAVSAVLSILPGHLGNLIEDVQAILADIKGTPPAAPPGPPGIQGPSGPPAVPPPPVSTRGRVGLAMMRLGVALVLVAAACDAFGITACKPAAVPPNTSGDIGAAVACVIADAITNQPFTNCVTQFGNQLVADAIQIALNSKPLADANPKAMLVLQAHVAQ